MATSEEFSFPISSETSRSFMDSPPLWRRVTSTRYHHQSSYSSSNATPTPTPTRDVIGGHSPLERKSFSGVEESIVILKHSPIEMDEADKMDLLWEDFNNEEILISSRRMASLDIDHESCGELGYSPHSHSSSYSSSSTTATTNSSSTSSSSAGSDLLRGEVVELRCVPPGFKVFRGGGVNGGGGAVVANNNKKLQRVAVAVKVLRLFLLQKLTHDVKSRKKCSSW